MEPARQKPFSGSAERMELLAASSLAFFSRRSILASRLASSASGDASQAATAPGLFLHIGIAEIDVADHCLGEIATLAARSPVRAGRVAV